jgi:hypothetical protein
MNNFNFVASQIRVFYLISTNKLIAFFLPTQRNTIQTLVAFLYLLDRDLEPAKPRYRFRMRKDQNSRPC